MHNKNLFSISKPTFYKLLQTNNICVCTKPYAELAIKNTSIYAHFSTNYHKGYQPKNKPPLKPFPKFEHGTYIHLKSGVLYTSLTLTYVERDLSIDVIYKNKENIFSRPLLEFTSNFLKL